jgi:crotonobetainyl-CoA:carnitine CoA-transferase CaiB-like acyl-CoA transferase
MTKDCIRKFSNNELPELTQLINLLNMSDVFSGDFILQGRDPLIYSPHRLGYASAIAQASNAILAAALWEKRTGQVNQIFMNVIDALHHLHDSHYLWQNGYKLEVGADRAPINSFFKCKDNRFIHTIAGPPYIWLLNDYLNFFDCGNNKDSFEREFSKWNSFELEEALSAAKLPACVARTKCEWSAHPVGKFLSKIPVISIEKVSEGKPVKFSPEPKACLSGINALDFTHVLAGPLCSSNLAQFGAKVLHISSPEYRDSLSQNLIGNFGKKNAYLNLKEKHDKDLMFQLVKKSDVFCASYRPSVVKKFSLDMESISNINTRGIVYMSISCYGDGHEWSDRPGFETIGQACTGFSMTEAEARNSKKPLFSPVFYLNDPLTAYFAFSGILAALYRRSTEGGSYHVKVSLVRTGMWVTDLGYIPNEDYRDLPESDNYPANFQETNTIYGVIKKLKECYHFDNMPYSNNPEIFPFGASLPSFDD